jgi:ABC-2 type transport system ATP-binding protein
MSGIHATGLRKRFGETQALNGFDLSVATGSVCGLLGHNGAGKTTAVRVLSTLARLDEGRAEVAGFDVARAPAQVRAHVGLVGQHAAVDEVLSGRDNLELFGRLFHLGASRARVRADELLERFDLADAAGRSVSTYSGGMRRRLDLAASLIPSPPVLLLDEPTAGLDPRGRNEVWTAVRGLVDDGATVLLTTQYLEEADQLADRVTVMTAGRVAAEGTPDELKARFGGDRIDVLVDADDQLAAARSVLACATDAEPDVEPEALRVSAPVSDRARALATVARGLDAAGIAPRDISLRRPTLDDAFLALTEGET